MLPEASWKWTLCPLICIVQLQPERGSGAGAGLCSVCHAVCDFWQNMPLICHLGWLCPCLGVLVNMYLMKISSCYCWGNLSSPGNKFWNVSVQHNVKFHNRDAFLDGSLLRELWMNLTCRNAEDLAFWVLFDIVASVILFKISSFTLCVMLGVIHK